MIRLEEVTQSRIKKVLDNELYVLRLRASQWYTKHLEIEKSESLVKIDWDTFFMRYRLLRDEFNKRNLSLNVWPVDMIFEKEKYFGIKIIEKQSTGIGTCFSMLAQIGNSNILINPAVKREQISEQVHSIIVTKLDVGDTKRLKDYMGKVPIYATGKTFDKISSKAKHLFIKSLKIGSGQVMIRPIRVAYKKRDSEICLKINKEDVKLSILPKFLSLSKGTKDLIEKTVWICEVPAYDKDDDKKEALSFLSLIKLAQELRPRKIFIVNANKELLEHKEEMNQELVKWQGRILYDGDTLEEAEIMKGLAWEINELDTQISSSDIFDSSIKFAKNEAKDKLVAEVNFNGVRVRIEKKDKDVIIMVKPENIEGSPLQSQRLPIQVSEIVSFKENFVGDATIVIAHDKNNECLGVEAVEKFLKQKSDPEEINKKIHIFITDLLQFNGNDISSWPLEKRKKVMNNFGSRDHVHFVKPITDTSKNSLSYIIDIGGRKEIRKVFDNIMKFSDEGKFYPKNIAKGVIFKCLACSYSEKRIVISKPEKTENYHRIPVTDCKITATVNISTSEGIKALYCGDSKEIATYLFNVDKWTMETAKTWVKEQMEKVEEDFRKKLTAKQQKDYDNETELINANKEKTEAEKVHNFKNARWTFPNGHPRCLVCGDEESIGGVCNMPDEWYQRHEWDDIEAWQKEREILREKGTLKKRETTIPNLEKAKVSFDFKKVDDAEYIVGGIVYPSKKVDSQGHFAVKSEVWKALKKYMIEKKNIKIMHKGVARSIPIIENYFVEEDHHKGGTAEQFLIHKGDWWLSVFLGNDENKDIWKDVKSGKLTGFSMAGKANQEDTYVY